MNIPREFSQPVRIGRGSFSTVYRVYQRKLERHAVLKILPLPRPEDAGRIEKEAHVLASMRLPCVPHIYDIVRFRKKIIIVMEWIRGIPLASLMEHSLANNALLEIASKIISAMTLLHANNIVHRDLKPENIIVTADCGIFLVDFGFSCVHRADSAASGVMQGTPSYMAPELWACNDAVDYKKADLFALGAVLKNLLDYEFPAFAGALTESDPALRPQDCASFEKIWREHFSPLSDAEIVRECVGTAVEQYIARLLTNGACDLYAKGRTEDAYELITESLEVWPDNAEALDYLQNKFSTPIRKPKKKRVTASAAAVFAGIAAIVSAYMLGMRSSPQKENIDFRSLFSDTERRDLSLLSTPRHLRPIAPLPAALRTGATGLDLTGRLVVVDPGRNGSLFIDGVMVSRRQEERVSAPLPVGTHRVEWFDSTMQRKYGETIELLPFEIKTISLTRFFDGT